MVTGTTRFNRREGIISHVIYARVLTVQHRREAVRRDVEHAAAARDQSMDGLLDLVAIGAVVLLDNLRS